MFNNVKIKYLQFKLYIYVMVRFFFTLMLFSPFSIYSQHKLEIEGEFKLLTHKDSIKVFSKNKLLVFDEGLNLVREEQFSFDQNIIDFKILLNEDQTFFVSIRGGQVYKKKGREGYYRIDKSFDHRMQSESTIIFKNDTIFKFGGYGFWSMRNFITYFNFDQSEWFALEYSDNNLSDGYSNTLFNFKKNDFYFLGGNKMDGLFKIKPNKKIFHFSNLKKEWNEIGEIEIPITLDGFHFFNKNSFYIIYESLVSKIDLENKTITNYKKHSSLYSGIRFKFAITSVGDKVFFVTQEDKQLFLNKLPLSELLGEKISERRFLRPNNFFLFLLVGFILIVSLLMIKRKKNNELIIVYNQQLLFGRKKIEISKFQSQLIEILIKNNPTMNKDFDILNENGYLNKYHFQRTLKNEILQINLIFKSLTNLNHKMIFVKKDKVDKRINIYQLNGNYNFIIK